MVLCGEPKDVRAMVECFGMMYRSGRSMKINADGIVPGGALLRTDSVIAGLGVYLITIYFLFSLEGRFEDEELRILLEDMATQRSYQ